MKPTPVLGRPAARRREIVSELRQQIVDGSLPPGSRVPTRLEIESRFGVSPLTVHRALQRLRDDGFITVNGRQGTYVADHPPHLTNFALIFPGHPNAAPWVRFWTALSNEAGSLALPGEQTLKIYHDINGEPGNTALAELSREVSAHRVAGLIFASSPHLLEGTPIMDEPDIPRVAIQSSGLYKEYPRVNLDRALFYERALTHLKERGRRRVACIGPALPLNLADDLLPLPARHGLETRPYWWQGVGPGRPEAARNCAHLLLNPHQTERPDALIISDDNLVEWVMDGVRASGVRAEDLDIVAHCNFSGAPAETLPCRRLGFDTRQVLNSCIEIIEAQRRGQDAPAVTLIPPVFEDELVN